MYASTAGRHIFLDQALKYVRNLEEVIKKTEPMNRALFHR